MSNHPWILWSLVVVFAVVGTLPNDAALSAWSLAAPAPTPERLDGADGPELHAEESAPTRRPDAAPARTWPTPRTVLALHRPGMLPASTRAALAPPATLPDTAVPLHAPLRL